MRAVDRNNQRSRKWVVLYQVAAGITGDINRFVSIMGLISIQRILLFFASGIQAGFTSTIGTHFHWHCIIVVVEVLM